MSRLSFNVVAGIVFGVVALAHAARLVLGLPVQLGDTSIPMWVSWLGLAVAGALCLWGFRSKP